MIIYEFLSCDIICNDCRYGHSATVIGSKMFVFGGMGKGGDLYRDLHSLDLISWEWADVRAITASPTPRFNHGCCGIGNKIVVQGGWDGGETAYNDLWVFDTSSFSWTQPRTAGFAPSPRYGHSLTFIPSTGQVVVFGGACFDEEVGCLTYLDDVKILDSSSMIWSRPSLSGKTPSPRFMHSACLVEGERIVISGGWGRGGVQAKGESTDPSAYPLSVLDLSSSKWRVPKRSVKRRVPNRYGHEVVTIAENLCMMFGGFDGKQAVNSLLVLEFS